MPVIGYLRRRAGSFIINHLVAMTGLELVHGELAARAVHLALDAEGEERADGRH